MTPTAELLRDTVRLRAAERTLLEAREAGDVHAEVVASLAAWELLRASPRTFTEDELPETPAVRHAAFVVELILAVLGEPAAR